MAGTTTRRGRQRGRIESLPSGSLRVIVYAGVDPVTKRRHFLREVVPDGPSARKEAERTLRRLASQVDDQEQAKTVATVDQLLDQHFELLEVEPTTPGDVRDARPRPHPATDRYLLRGGM